MPVAKEQSAVVTRLLSKRSGRPSPSAALWYRANRIRRSPDSVYIGVVRRTGPFTRAGLHPFRRGSPPSQNKRGQRGRFVELYMAALDEAGLPNDDAFRSAIRSQVEFALR